MSSALSNAIRSPLASLMVLGVRAPAKLLLAAAVATVFTAILLPVTDDSPALTTQDAMHTATDNGNHSSADGALYALNSSPIYFETNRGQWGPSIRYTTQGDNYSIAFGARSMLLHVGTGGSSVTATLHFRGANPAPTLSMFDAAPHPGTAPTEIAPNRPHDTRTNVDAVSYRNVYPGIDVVFRLSQQRNLSYDFVVAHDADPSQIAFEYRGAQAPRIGADGDITLALGDEVIKQGVPAVYRSVGDTLVRVRGTFYQRADHAIAFSTQQ